MQALQHGINVAVVFQYRLPESWHGYRVINGDESDLRFLDDSPVVVGLKAKGQSKNVQADGFIQIQAPAMPTITREEVRSNNVLIGAVKYDGVKWTATDVLGSWHGDHAIKEHAIYALMEFWNTVGQYIEREDKVVWVGAFNP